MRERSRCRGPASREDLSAEARRVKRPARAIATVWSGQPGSNRRVDPRALRIHSARPPGGSRGFARRSMRGGFAALALPECRRFEQTSCPGAVEGVSQSRGA
jgi:hypothetical protein